MRHGAPQSTILCLFCGPKVQPAIAQGNALGNVVAIAPSGPEPPIPNPGSYAAGCLANWASSVEPHKAVVDE
jgi:hypothetical protein